MAAAIEVVLQTLSCPAQHTIIRQALMVSTTWYQMGPTISTLIQNGFPQTVTGVEVLTAGRKASSSKASMAEVGSAQRLLLHHNNRMRR